MQGESALTIAGGDGADGLLRGGPPVEYNRDEQRLSVYVQRRIDELVLGRTDHLVLLKLYPHRAVVGVGAGGARPELDLGAVRREVAARIAADALAFFGVGHGGVVTQQTLDDVILQGRRYSTAYPHINLERYDLYDAATAEPLLGAWRAWRIQNQRRETRTNRVIDVALLALEVGKSLFPRLLP